MHARLAYWDIVKPALDAMPRRYRSKDAARMLLAIGYQESRFTHLHQIRGPAHSYWQGELTGGLILVITHAPTRRMARICIEKAGFNPDDHRRVFEFLDEPAGQILACQLGRLLLWSDPHYLPTAGQLQYGWDYYINCWRPGKPHKQTWPDAWDYATAGMTAGRVRVV